MEKKRLMVSFLFEVGCLAILLQFFGCREASDLVSSRDFAVDPMKRYQPVKLRDIMARPSQYKGLDVMFSALFHRYESMWVPGFTVFTPEEYINFSVWSPDARVWNVEERKRDLPFLYLKRTSLLLHLGKPDFLSIPEYALVEIDGTVESDFNGYPWIDVHAIRFSTANPLYGKETIYHLTQGIDDFSSKKDLTAREHFETVLAAKPPLPAEVEARSYLAEICEKQKPFYSEAVEHYEWLVKHDPQNVAWRNGYEKIRGEYQREAAKKEPSKKPSSGKQSTESPLEALSKELATVKKQLEDTKAKSAQLEKEKEVLKSAHQKALGELENQKKQYQTLEKQKQQLEQTKTDLEKKCDDANKHAASAKEALAKRENALRDLEAQKGKDEKATSELQKMLKDTKKQLSSVSSELKEKSEAAQGVEKQNKQIAQKRDELQKKADDLTKQLNELANSKEKLESQQKLIRDLETQKGKDEKAASELQKKLKDTEKQLASVSNEFKGKVETIQDMEKKNTQLVQKRDELQRKVDAMTKQLSDLSNSRGKLESQQKLIAEFQKRTQATEDELSKVKGVMQARDNQHKFLEEAIRSGEGEVQKLRADVSEVRNQLAASTRDKEAIQKEVQELKAKQKTLEAKIAQLEADKTKLASGSGKVNSEAQERIKQLEKKNAVLEEANRALQREVKDLQEKE